MSVARKCIMSRSYKLAPECGVKIGTADNKVKLCVTPSVTKVRAATVAQATATLITTG